MRFEGSPCHPGRCPGLICSTPLGCSRACSPAPEGPSILAHGIAVGSFGHRNSRTSSLILTPIPCSPS